MIIISINIRGGINYKNKPYRVVNYLKSINYDIALLQEVANIKPKIQKILENELDSKIFLGKKTKQKQNIGVATLIKNDSNIEITDLINTDVIGEGRLQHIKIKESETHLNILNLYATTHTPAKNHQWKNLGNYIKPLDNVLIMGDYNSTINIDERMGNRDKTNIDKKLKQMIHENNLIDIPTLKDYKLHTYIVQKATSLLDRAIVTVGLADKIHLYTSNICQFSDHNCIILNIGKKGNIEIQTKKRRMQIFMRT